MDALTTTASAATVASLLTSLCKFGFPNLPSYAIMAISLFAGVGAAFLVSLATGDVLTTQASAQNIILGILAAAAAAGIDRASRSADVHRDVVRYTTPDE